MIKNKKQLKEAVKNNYKNITIKRIYTVNDNDKKNLHKSFKIKKIQSNAFMLDNNNWVYYDNIEVKDNTYYYYYYILENYAYLDDILKTAKDKGIEIIKIDENDKINKNNNANYKFGYKYISMINKIIEE